MKNEEDEGEDIGPQLVLSLQNTKYALTQGPELSAVIQGQAKVCRGLKG